MTLTGVEAAQCRTKTIKKKIPIEDKKIKNERARVDFPLSVYLSSISSVFFVFFKPSYPEPITIYRTNICFRESKARGGGSKEPPKGSRKQRISLVRPRAFASQASEGASSIHTERLSEFGSKGDEKRPIVGPSAPLHPNPPALEKNTQAFQGSHCSLESGYQQNRGRAASYALISRNTATGGMQRVFIMGVFFLEEPGDQHWADCEPFFGGWREVGGGLVGQGQPFTSIHLLIPLCRRSSFSPAVILLLAQSSSSPKI